jgi:hypothetical protein
MSEYGYIPESPEQSFGNNKGIFTPKDIYDLTRADKYTNYGQLELIETQTVSSAVAQVDFTNIKDDIYNVHLVIFSGLNGVSAHTEEVLFRMFESGTLESANVYSFARQGCRATGVFTEERYNTGYSAIRFSNWDYWDNDGSNNAYMYVYNAGDSSKYTFCSYHNTGFDSEYGGSGTYTTKFGSGSLPQLSVVDGFRFYTLFGTNIGAGTISLYGIKEY